MPALVIFRSLTHAQRGQRILQNNAIPASLIKAPAGTSEKGCAYALRVNTARLETARDALSRAGVSYERVLLPSPDGSFSEAEP